jgi:hypothetical protein
MKNAAQLRRKQSLEAYRNRSCSGCCRYDHASAVEADDLYIPRFEMVGMAEVAVRETEIDISEVGIPDDDLPAIDDAELGILETFVAEADELELEVPEMKDLEVDIVEGEGLGTVGPGPRLTGRDAFGEMVFDTVGVGHPHNDIADVSPVQLMRLRDPNLDHVDDVDSKVLGILSPSSTRGASLDHKGGLIEDYRSRYVHL